MGCGIVTFGGQKVTKKISLVYVVNPFSALREGFLTSRKEPHVHRNHRRHSDNHRLVAKYHAHHHHRTTKCSAHTSST